MAPKWSYLGERSLAPPWPQTEADEARDLALAIEASLAFVTEAEHDFVEVQGPGDLADGQEGQSGACAAAPVEEDWTWLDPEKSHDLEPVPQHPPVSPGPQDSSEASCGPRSASPTGQEARSSKEPKDAKKSKESGPQKSYAVWRAPLDQRARGVWVGKHSWPYILRALPGGEYRYATGCRLQGFDSMEEALQAYVQEAGRHGAPLPAQIHRP